MQHFSDSLYEAIINKDTPICVGLDPRLNQIPNFIRDRQRFKHKDVFTAAAECLIEFNKGIIDAVADLVPVVKVQSAFFEQYGHEGIRAFEDTLRYAKEKGLLVIADAKRGDIATTAEAYSHAFLGKIDLFDQQVSSFDADAVTVNPYFGFDGVKPFLNDAQKYGKGVFVLVKTSNLSSSDLQDRMTVDQLCNYEIMAHLVESWGADDIGKHGYSCIGVVVGASFPCEAQKLRQFLQHNFFLVPGYGAQGGSAKDVKVCFRDDGTGAIVNSSRDIIFAYENNKRFTEEDYAQAARSAVLKMKKELSESKN